MTERKSTTAARIASVRTQSVDTPPEVEAIQVRLFCEMGPRGRLAAALELNEALDNLAMAGIRSRHGALQDTESRLRLFALRLSREQMVDAFGWDPANT
jgi:inhibitor of KinA sporulation pathway (predicted exonuclease)